jgi:hypothetical protein
MIGDETSPERIALLDAAEGLIRDEGADGWTLAQLAGRANIGLAEIEAEFGSEWETFCVVMRRDEERFEQSVFRDSSTNPSGKIVALLEACVPNYDWPPQRPSDRGRPPARHGDNAQSKQMRAPRWRCRARR